MQTPTSASAQHSTLFTFQSIKARLIFLLVTLMAAMSFAGALSAQVFINEIHYDNTGTDAGEAIEVAGPAGTDLTGWTIALYNGSASQLSVYATINLTGTIADQSGGYGTLSFAQAGIQNGAPDGLALVDPGSSVIQFLSYEGSFTAGSGPANGMTSTDIGVSESSGTAVGDSLQLTGSGTVYGDFTWAGAQANTFGAVNTGQTFGSPEPATIIINEVDADQTSTDSAEFIELYDGGAGNTALDGLVLVLMNGSDDASYLAFDLDGHSTNADGYFVLCGNAATTDNCDLDVSPDTNLIQNGADAVALYAGDATDFPNDTPVTTTNLLDAIVYDTSDGDDAGLLVLLNGGQPQVNENGNGAKDTESNQRCANGSGGLRNTDTYEQFAPTPGLANQCGTVPSILINEVDADQTGTDSAEFVELYDGGAGNTALDGLVLVLMNGSDDASYQAFDLDGQSTNADGYFVLCGNAATTANCDMDVSPDTNLIQNGADAVALYTGDATDFPEDTPVTTINLLDAIVYDTDDGDDAGLLVLLNAGQPQVNERAGGSGTTHSNQRCTNGSGGARNTDTYGQFIPTPGAVNCEAPPPPLEECGDPVTFIHDIQGNGPASPLTGTTVSIEGIVVGDFQDGAVGTDGDLNGFFVQEEDVDADADPGTSEGIFVLDGSSPAVDVQNGDRVRVAGTVSEFFGLTRVNSTTFIDVCLSGAGLPVETTINLPRASVDDWEATEGMLVTFPQTLFVTNNFTLARFGEVGLSVDTPLDIPTNVVAPGAPALALQDLNDRSRIQLDDGSSVQNPLPLPRYLNLDKTRRVGDSITDLTGVLSYGFGSYEVQPTATVEFVTEAERPLDPPIVGGLIRVAGFNVLNYFTTLDGDGSICGPLADMNCRGADNVEEFTRQKAKLVAALTTLNADVVGLIELENAADNTPIADLVAGLNAVLGAGTYAYVDTGAIGSDAIRQGIIYKPDTVTMQGTFETLDSADDPLFDDTRNRPALAQTFSENSTGAIFTVVVNHLKSKGSNCNSADDPDAGDGQGNCNLVRTAAAAALVDWLAGDPTASGDSDTIIIGDLNAYAMEDPITTIMDGGYADLINAFAGTGFTDGAYSFNFGGQAGYLDHALASPSLVPLVNGTAIWHINADEPSGLDYNDYNQPDLYNPDPFRASDHDAVVVGLFTDEDEDGIEDQIDVCPGTVIPESIPTKELGTNRFALVDGDGVFDTRAPKGKGPKASFDISATAGCSCEQIIEAQELGKGHRKFGCSVGEMEEWVELMTVP